MKDDSDDAWFEAIRGRPGDDTDPVLLDHAISVRTALLERRQESTDPDEDEALDRLLFRLRQEDLLPGRSATLSRLLPAAIAASVLAVTSAAVYLSGGSERRDTRFWSSRDAPVVHKVRDPQFLAHQLNQRLLVRNASVSLTSDEKGTQSLTAQVPPDQAASARSMLASFGINSMTSSGRLRVDLSVGETVAVLRSRDPDRTAAQLRVALLFAGSEVESTDVGDGRHDLRIQSTPEQHGAVVHALEEFGLGPPGADGAMRIEVRRETGPISVWTASRILPPL